MTLPLPPKLLFSVCRLWCSNAGAVFCPKSQTFGILVVICQSLCYPDIRKASAFSAASNGGRLALLTGGDFLPPDLRKGGVLMVTYSDLFQYSLVIIGIIALFIQANKKK